MYTVQCAHAELVDPNTVPPTNTFQSGRGSAANPHRQQRHLLQKSATLATMLRLASPLHRWPFEATVAQAENLSRRYWYLATEKRHARVISLAGQIPQRSARALDLRTTVFYTKVS